MKFIYFSEIKYRPEFENILKGIIDPEAAPVASTKSAFDIVKNINRKSAIEKSKTEGPKDQKQHNLKVDNLKKCICEILKAINQITRENLDMTDLSNQDKCENFPEFLKEKLIEKIRKDYGGYEFRYKHMFEKDSSEIQTYFYAAFLEKNLEELSEEYKKDNYSLLFTELIKERQHALIVMKNDAINQICLKINNSDKLNKIMESNLRQLKQLEKFVNIEYLIEKMEVPIKLEITENNEHIITKLNINILDASKSKDKDKNSPDYCANIQDFIRKFPNFNSMNIRGKNILDYEEEISVQDSVESYFKHIKGVLKQNLGSRYKADEINQMFKDINNYIIGNAINLCLDPNGIYVIREFIKNLKEPINKTSLVLIFETKTLKLCIDQFGNFAIQDIINKLGESKCKNILKKIKLYLKDIDYLIH